MEIKNTLAAALAAGAAALGLAAAQTPLTDPSGQARPGSDRLLPPPEFLNKEDDAIALPAPPPVSGETGAGGATVLVQTIEIICSEGAGGGAEAAGAVNVTGNCLVPAADIADVARPYQGRYLTTEDILALRDAVTILMINSGFINSGAVIPPQDIADGVLRIEIVKGRLTEVTVTPESDLRGLRSGYVTSRMPFDEKRPLNQKELEEKFQFLISDPNIERVDARLSPGEAPGEATLDLGVTGAKRYFANVTFANDRSPSVGGNRVALQGGVRNLLGLGDLLTGEVGATRGLVDAAATYAVPLTANDLIVTVGANYSDAEVIEAPLNDLDVISLSYGARLGLTMPVWRSYTPATRGVDGDNRGKRDRPAVTRVATLGAEVSFNRSETELLGQNFSFSPGAVDGVTEITAARATQAFVQQSARQVIAVRSTFALGLDALDPVVQLPLTPPKNFFVWLGQAQYARRINEAGHQLTARLDAQIAADPLFPTEKFALGGQTSVRGYRMNQTLSDSGVIGSVEYSVPVASLVGAKVGSLASLRLSTFVDGGYGWNVNAADPADDLLVSAGVGAAFSPIDGVSVSASWAARFENPPDVVDRGPQDWGLGFRVTANPAELLGNW